MFRFASLSLIFSLPCWLYCQTTFKEGYLITPAGERQTVEIRDRDWATNPQHFTYRVTGGETRRGDLSTVIEFGLLSNEVRYVRSTVDLEVSPREINSLSKSSLPEYRRQEVFLEVLVEGAADLFYFRTPSLKQFFYRLGSGPIKPLINRQYLRGDRIVQQDLYRSVLGAILDCGYVPERLDQLTFNRKSLVRYFEEYHRCTEEDYRIYERQNEHRRFRLALRAGVDQHSSTIGVIYPGGVVNPVSYDAIFVPRLSIEAELSFSFLHAQWALAGEIYYQAFRQEWPEGASGEPINIEIKGINVPLGIRYYIYQSGKIDWYANAYGHILLPVGGQVEWRSWDLETFISMTPGAGMGVRFADHIQLELRYSPAQDVLRRNNSFQHRQRTFSLVGGYQF